MDGPLPISANARQKFTTVAMCLLLIVVTAALYLPVRNYDFISFDDGDYVKDNVHVRSGFSVANVVWAFTKSHSSNWHPLTWLSHMLDCQLFGLNAGAHHLTNLLFHATNAGLLFLVLRAMTTAYWRSAFVAALFAWHPVHVESVAWIAERKDVLSTLFWILTMGAYLFYVKNPNWRRYLPVVFCYALGLMSKPMLVTLPFVLILLDYWPLGRITLGQPTAKAKGSGFSLPMMPRCIVLEKVPLIALAVMSSLITFIVQRQGGAMASLEGVPFTGRMANAVVSYFAYIGKMLWPVDLALYYPRSSIPGWQAVSACLGLLGISAVAVLSCRKRPYLPVGWFWYLGSLVPVIGLVQVGDQAMADRYTYVPLIGLFIIVGWGVPQLLENRSYRRAVLFGGAGVVLVACVASTAKQLTYWRDSYALFQHSLAIAPDSWPVRNNLGSVYFDRQDYEKALVEYQISLRLNPDNPEAQNNMGNLKVAQKQIEESIPYYLHAMRLRPKDAGLYNNLGNVRMIQGKFNEAARQYREAVRLKPDYAEAQFNWGTVLFTLGKADEAIERYEEAVRLKPDYAQAHSNLASALLFQGRAREAIEHHREALRLLPDSAVARSNLAWVLATCDDPARRNGPEAVRLAEDAAELTKRQDPVALDTLAAALAETGRFDEAVEAAERAQELALSAGQTALATEILARRKLYERHRPYRK